MKTIASAFSVNVITRRCEKTAQWIAILTAFFLPLSTTMLSILYPLAAGLSLCAGRWQERLLPCFRSPVILIFCVFYSLFLIGILYSSAPAADITVTLLKYSKFLSVVFIFPLFTEKRYQQYAVNAFLTAMLITMLLAYLQTFNLLHLNTSYTNASEIFKTHIETNFLMAFTAYLLIYKSIHQTKYRLFWRLFLILAVINVFFLSTGRSGYIVFFVLLALFLWQQFKWRGLVIALISLAILSFTVYTFSENFKTRMLQLKRGLILYQQGNSKSSIGHRLRFVENSLILIKQHPVIGTGTGSFKTEYAKIATEKKLQTNNPHNEFINIAVQLGLAGLLVLLMVFYIPWRESARLPAFEKYLAQGTVLAIFTGCFGNSWLMDITESHFYLYFLTLAFAGTTQALRRQVQNRRREKQNRRLAIVTR